MKVSFLVVTRKGHYAERVYEARNVADALKKFIPAMEELPDTIDGEKLIDWSRINIEIRR